MSECGLGNVCVCGSFHNEGAHCCALMCGWSVYRLDLPCWRLCGKPTSSASLGSSPVVPPWFVRTVSQSINAAWMNGWLNERARSSHQSLGTAIVAALMDRLRGSPHLVFVSSLCPWGLLTGGSGFWKCIRSRTESVQKFTSQMIFLPSSPNLSSSGKLTDYFPCIWNVNLNPPTPPSIRSLVKEAYGKPI